MDYSSVVIGGLYLLFLVPLLWGLATGLASAGSRQVTGRQGTLGMFTVPAAVLLLCTLLIQTPELETFGIGTHHLQAIGVFLALLNWLALLLVMSLLAVFYHTGLLYGLTFGPKSRA